MKCPTHPPTGKSGWPLVAGALMLAVAPNVHADFVRSSVSLGGYLIDAEDAPHDGNLYQNERIQVNALKNKVGLNVAYGYSDLYDKRPNTYAQANRLALANLTYETPITGLQLKLGRDFAPLLDRAVYFDGGGAKLALNGKVQAELFGGFGVPTQFEDDIASFDSDKGIIGGKLTFAPIPTLVIHADGIVNGRYDDGTLGLQVQQTASDRVSLSAGSVYRLDSSTLYHGDVSALVRVRESDEFQVRLTFDDQKIDSTRYYDYFVNQAHNTLMTGYGFRLNAQVRFNADYGLVVYEDETGHIVDFKASAFGAYVSAEKQWQTITDALNLNVGYGGLFADRWLFNMNYGYSLYDLQPNKLNLTAVDFTVSPGIQFRKGLQLNVGYEYLENRMYSSDNRFFVGIKHSFFKGLTP